MPMTYLFWQMGIIYIYIYIYIYICGVCSNLYTIYIYIYTHIKSGLPCQENLCLFVFLVSSRFSFKRPPYVQISTSPASHVSRMVLHILALDSPRLLPLNPLYNHTYSNHVQNIVTRPLASPRKRASVPALEVCHDRTLTRHGRLRFHVWSSSWSSSFSVLLRTSWATDSCMICMSTRPRRAMCPASRIPCSHRQVIKRLYVKVKQLSEHWPEVGTGRGCSLPFLGRVWMNYARLQRYAKGAPDSRERQTLVRHGTGAVFPSVCVRGFFWGGLGGVWGLGVLGGVWGGFGGGLGGVWGGGFGGGLGRGVWFFLESPNKKGTSWKALSG